MGLAELLFGDREQVPPKVAINEAIELAKTFGGENSGKFVNGVLGAVYKEIGEPGKDQISKPKAIKNKEPEEPIDISKLPVEAKAGGLIFTHHEGEVLVAIVHDVFGYWTLVKSGAEEGEKYEDTAIRSVKQKLGLDAKVIAEIGKIEYVASHPEKKKILKVVAYFLMEAPYKELELKSNGGLDKADWMKPEQLVDLTIYDDILPSIAKAIEIINSK
jgi:ADP-ribose pyrophosphatase YjhB (NUDIX family)